ncbi:hypothetical protein DXN05_03870 [Deminuibacter soli]|uniref:Uncharacterized protein n=2 Tax=Deminuibacter soli TaxID=2291815 RepID=A0A3E1NQB8_9BACT|nr:hypothetical protein DXN05_03870 [Deminuibacter soli]
MGIENVLLVIERDNTNVWSSLAHTQREKMFRYKGFSGMQWPLYEEWSKAGKILFEITNDLGSYADKEAIISYTIALKAAFKKEFDLLLLNPTKEKQDPHILFRGYDVGILEEFEEPIFFSGILNEIRENGNPNLIKLQSYLNENYLFSTAQQCEAYLSARHEAEMRHELSYIETAYNTSQFAAFSIYEYLI